MLSLMSDHSHAALPLRASHSVKNSLSGSLTLMRMAKTSTMMILTILLTHTVEMRAKRANLLLLLCLLLPHHVPRLLCRTLRPLLGHHVLLRSPQALAALSAKDVLPHALAISMEKSDILSNNSEMWKILALGKKWLKVLAAPSAKNHLVTFPTQLHHLLRPLAIVRMMWNSYVVKGEYFLPTFYY
jgi:hypothetical protein